MKKLLIYSLLILVCTAMWASPAAVNGSAVLATVNGQAVTLGEVLSESSGNEALAQLYASENVSGEIERLRKEAVDRIIDRKLLVEEFDKLKLELPQKYVENMLDDLAESMNCKSRSELAAKARAMNSSIDDLREKAAMRIKAEMVIGRAFYAAGTPTPREVNQYFTDNIAKYSKPEQLNLALLLLADKTAQSDIEKIQNKLQADSLGFAGLVKSLSLGPNRENGGVVGFIARKNLRSEFAAVLPEGKVAVNKVYGPVKTPEGIYFLKVIAIDPGKKANLADHRNAIMQLLEKELREKVIADLQKRLRERAVIQYYFKRDEQAQNNQKIQEKKKPVPVKEKIKKEEKRKMVTLKTNFGDIKLELFADAAPQTVANFLEYVNSGFYNGTLFHRVIDNFMIQGGGFDQKFKQKKTREPIQNEADNRLSNEIGTIAMARTMDPHSATAQFFINVANNDFLDFRSPSPQFYGYCVFGKVVEGMDVVNKIKGVKTGGRAGHQDVPKEDVVIIEAIAD